MHTFPAFQSSESVRAGICTIMIVKKPYLFILLGKDVFSCGQNIAS